MTHPAQRTPVSLLQELCACNEAAAEYTFLYAVGASHAPTFTFEVQVSDIIIKANGASKQKAKHAAAKLMLQRLLSEKFKEGFEFDGIQVTAENLDEIVLETVSTSQEEVLLGNPVGALQELCMKMKWSPPYYETISVDGPPHDRTFHISCAVEEFSFQSGIAKTKKVAKRHAADEMLKFFKEAKIRTNNLPNFITYWKAFKDDLVQSLQEIDLSDSTLDYEKQLHKLSSEKNCDLLFGVLYIPIEHRGLNGEYYNFVQITTSDGGEFEIVTIDETGCKHLAVITFISSGTSKEEAKTAAARNAIKFFQNELK